MRSQGGLRNQWQMCRWRSLHSCWPMRSWLRQLMQFRWTTVWPASRFGHEQLRGKPLHQGSKKVVKESRREVRLRMGNLQQRCLRRSWLQASLCRSKCCTKSFGSSCSSQRSSSTGRCSGTTGSSSSQPLPAAIICELRTDSARTTVGCRADRASSPAKTRRYSPSRDAQLLN